LTFSPLNAKALIYHVLDIDAPTMTFPFFPPWTLFFNAGHQGRIKIRVQVILDYRIFLAAPESFHNPGSALVLKGVMPSRGYQPEMLRR